MKIGLLTVYSFNYGSFFQASSLYKELESLGYEVEFINERFKKYKWENMFLLYSFDSLLPGFSKDIIADKLPQYRTYQQLKADLSSYKESADNIYDMKEISKNYDLIIVGADEMWSASNQSIRYTKEHFGYNLSCPHISYATCGSLFDMKDKELKKKASQGLKSFKAISVRDNYTAKVVEKLTGIKADIVLDPTLLNPYFIHDYDSAEENYILLYGQHYDQDQKNFILDKAKKLNCKIMSLGWPIDFADGFLNPDTADEFQACFAKAAFCFPSTFHGTIFSILNHRPFISMVNSLRGKKIKMLLKDLELTDRIFDKDKQNYNDIDYDRIEKILSEKRIKSRNILISNINKCFEKKNLSDFICNPDMCTSCGACYAVCPSKAISFTQDKEGFYKPVIDKNKCSGCGLCKKICPVNNPDKSFKHKEIEDNKEKNNILAACLNDKSELLKSSSGGVFYGIAKAFIENGGVVYGAAFDSDFSVKHIRVDNIKDLDKLRSSKYVQSQNFDGIKKALNDLKEGKKVLYSGTACQIKGLLNLVDNKDNLYTIDILCHGVPSSLIFKDYLNYMSRLNKSQIKSVNFRDKESGWRKQAIKLEFKNGKIYRNYTDSDPFYVLYFKNIMLSNACYKCEYTSFERIADLTLGDYWGINNSNISKLSADDIGVNIVMVNSVKAMELISNCDNLSIYPADESSAYQPILVSPSIASKEREEFWNDYKNGGFSSIINKYGKLNFSNFYIKKVAVPISKKIGLYDRFQKLYFGRNKQK